MTKGATLALVGLGVALLALFAGSSKAEEQEPDEPEPVPPPDRPPYTTTPDDSALGPLVGPPAGPPPAGPPKPAPPAPAPKPVRPSELERLQAGYRILRQSELNPELVRTANELLKLGDPPGKMYPFDYQGRKLAGLVTMTKDGKRGVVLLERPV